MRLPFIFAQAGSVDHFNAPFYGVRTGQVASFPYGGEDQYEMMMLYTIDSRLLKVTWADTTSWPYGPCIEQDLLLEGLEFRVLTERRVPRRDFCNG